MLRAFRTSLGASAMIMSLTLFLRSASAATQVGAYYYPWYGTYPGGHGWTQTLREHLVPQQPPALGYYSSCSSAATEGQIDQSHRGNISFWATSW